MKLRIPIALASVLAATVVLFATTGSVTASADSPTTEHISGTLHFCAAGPCPPALTWVGPLQATGPFAGTATVNVLSDRPNGNFTKDQTVFSLSVPSANGDESILISASASQTSSTAPGPCPFDATSTCIDFTVDGHWLVALGTGPYRYLGGGGTLHADGVAVNHATGVDGYSDVYYNLSGHIGRQG